MHDFWMQSTMRRVIAALLLFTVLLGCSGSVPFDSVLPPPISHHFVVVAYNGTGQDIFVDIYLDDHYYPAGFVPGVPAGFPTYGTSITGPYNFEPHRVIINWRLPDQPSVQWGNAQYFYYNVDYGVATAIFYVLLLPPPPPAPPTLVVTGG